MKYKILTNGFVYRVKKKVWLLFWVYERDVSSFGGKRELREFLTLEKAEDYIAYQKKKHAKFHKVTNRKETELWKTLDDEE